MVSVVDIWNMALGAAGAQCRVTTTSDHSREAEICLLYYEQVRNTVFGMVWWPSLKATARLALSREWDGSSAWEEGMPLPGYRFAYALPANCCRPRHLSSYSNFELADGMLHTNAETAVLTYTRAEEDPQVWGAELVEMVTAFLAAKVVLPISKNQSLDRDAKRNAAEVYKSIAPAAFNHEQPSYHETIPPELVVRGHSSPLDLRFTYPLETCPYGAIGSIQFYGR